MEKLKGKKVAILATDGFEHSELISPKEHLTNHGAEVHIVSPKKDSIKSWKDGNWGVDMNVDKMVTDADSSEYHALVIPGGVINPDKLRRDDRSVDFVREFFKQHKPVASICHGPQMLIEAEVVDGRRVTSFHSIATDLKNAGAKWEDSEVVTDQGLVTSRSPEDLEAFNGKLIEEIMEGKHEEQTV
jgi:protease I